MESVMTDGAVGMSARAETCDDVLAAARGDQDAYIRLVQAHKGTVVGISLAIVRDIAASEDVAQEVFLEAWKRLASLRNAASFLPWLRQLARNRAHDSLRRRRPWRVAEDGDRVLGAIADPRPAALDGLLSDEEARLVTEALDALPSDAREVVILYYREGQSVEQVAALLGLKPAAVKKRLSRARERIREAVERPLGESLGRSAPRASFAAGVLAALPNTPQLAPVAVASVATAYVAALVLVAAVATVALLATKAGGNGSVPEDGSVLSMHESDPAAEARADGATRSGTEDAESFSADRRKAARPVAGAKPGDDEGGVISTGRIAGRIVTADGAPADAVRIMIACRNDARAHFEYTKGQETATVSGAAGQFVFEEMRGVDCYLSSKDALRGDVTALARPGDGAVELRLQRGGTVRGALVGADGNVLEDVTGQVGVHSETEGNTSEELVHGTFEIRHLSAGDYVVDAMLLGLPNPAPVLVKVIEGEAVAVQLVPGARGVAVRGRVVNGSGTPVPAATILLRNGEIPVRAGVTDAAGRFALSGLAGDVTLSIWAESEDLQFRKVLVGLADAGDVDLGEIALVPLPAGSGTTAPPGGYMVYEIRAEDSAVP